MINDKKRKREKEKTRRRGLLNNVVMIEKWGFFLSSIRMS
jgi:hypothetical protein